MSEVLQYTNVVSLSNDFCLGEIGHLYVISDSMICGLGNVYKGACKVSASTP